MCLTPLVLIGYLFALQPNPGHSTEMRDALLEYQTCERGLGLDLKASTAGVYGAHLQYGMPIIDQSMTVTFTPKFGVGFLDRQVPELSTHTNFSFGAQLLAGDDTVHVGLEYWHQSNAGLGSRNIGLDMLVIMTGFTFH